MLVGEDFLYDGHVVTDEPALEDLSLRGRDARVERAQFPQAHDLVAEGRARVLRGLQNEDIQEWRLPLFVLNLKLSWCFLLQMEENWNKNNNINLFAIHPPMKVILLEDPR